MTDSQVARPKFQFQLLADRETESRHAEHVVGGELPRAGPIWSRIARREFRGIPREQVNRFALSRQAREQQADKHPTPQSHNRRSADSLVHESKPLERNARTKRSALRGAGATCHRSARKSAQSRVIASHASPL